MFKFKFVTTNKDSIGMHTTAEFTDGNAVDGAACYATALQGSIDALRNFVVDNVGRNTAGKSLFVAVIHSVFKDVANDAISIGEKLFEQESKGTSTTIKPEPEEDDNSRIRLIRAFKPDEVPDEN